MEIKKFIDLNNPSEGFEPWVWDVIANNQGTTK